MERDQILFCFARFLLDHVRKAKKAPMRKINMHANTIPAMAPEFNDDVEKVLLFCDKGASEDVGWGDKVDDDRDTDEVSDLEEVEVGAGVDIWDGEVCGGSIVLVVIKVVVVFNNMLVRLLDWEVVEGERLGLDVERSNRISTTVTVVGVGSLLFPLLLSLLGQATMSLSARTEMQ